MADCRLWWGIAVVGIAVAGGCGPQAVSGGAVQADRGQAAEGHVYLAQLATHHPLYADLGRLDEAISALRRPDEPATLPLLDPPLSLAGPYAVGPVAVELRETTLGIRREGAVERVSAALPLEAPDSLPPDLEARLGWSKVQAERAAARELLEAQSAAGRDVAAHTARLYRENQERLNDLGDRIVGAPPAREAVIAELEAEIADLQQEHEHRLAELEVRLAARTRAEISEAERAAWEEARRRLVAPTGPLAGEPAGMMSRNMRAAEFPAWPAQVRVEFPQPELPAPDAVWRRSGEDVEQRLRQARERQVEALVGGRAETTRRILAATRLAAERIARERGVRVRFPPAEAPVGPDMTEEIGAALRQLWTPDTP